MLPEIEVFGFTISTYGLMVVLGILAVLIYFNLRKKTFSVPEADVQLAIIYGSIGAFIGAKCLYLFTILPQLRENLPLLASDPIGFLTAVLTGGFVFYGGIYGALAAAVIYCKAVRVDWWKMAECIVPVVPLFHVFGRIGCFLAGCCYGIEVPFGGLAFTVSQIAPNGVRLLPVQLIEAAAELILFLALIRMDRKEGEGRRMTSVWLIGYGAVRFILEFFRGDSYRGWIGAFSLSQILAVGSIVLGIWFLYRGVSARELSVG